jgi:hypothetical protein
LLFPDVTPELLHRFPQLVPSERETIQACTFNISGKFSSNRTHVV